MSATAEYRRWLEQQSPYWKKQLREGDAAPRRTARLNQIELPAHCVELFGQLDGQKSDKQWALPGDGEQGLALLSVEECAASRSNNLGLNLLVRNLPHAVEYECEPGVRSGPWRKGWFPIARRNNSWGWTLLFLGQEPQAGAPAGRLVLQTQWLGNRQARCLRTVVAESIPALFSALMQLVEARRLVCQADRGVAFAAGDSEAAMAIGMHHPHAKLGKYED